MIQVGDTVKWIKPLSDAEATERFTVTEVNGDRCFVKFVCDMAIAPVSLARVAELEKVA